MPVVPVRGPDRSLTTTVWMLTNSCRPWRDSSRPYPESLTPPNGSRGPEAVIPLTAVWPASSLAAMASPRSRSAVHTLLPSPLPRPIRHARERYPLLDGLRRDMADNNQYMRRVNDSLGYLPTHTTYEYQLDL
jgi:hypothetical protein